MSSTEAYFVVAEEVAIGSAGFDAKAAFLRETSKIELTRDEFDELNFDDYVYLKNIDGLFHITTKEDLADASNYGIIPSDFADPKNTYVIGMFYYNGGTYFEEQLEEAIRNARIKRKTMQYRIVDVSNVSDEDFNNRKSLGLLPELSECYFNGYSVFDRELEDVYIKVVLSEDKSEILVSDEGFPKHLNFSHYKEELQNFAQDNDIFAAKDELDSRKQREIMIIKRESDDHEWKVLYD